MIIIKLLRPIANLCRLVSRAYLKIVLVPLYKSRLGYCGKGVRILFRKNIKQLSHVFLYDDVFIADGFTFISYTGKLIMKEHSGAAANFTVVTGNHRRVVGRYIMDTERERSNEDENDVVIDEDVEIGTNVTLLSGVHIGRGATIGAGAVVRDDVPPYAIVVGNPAKVIAFSFTPDEVEEHEATLYPEDRRIDIDKYEEDYHKYFISRIKELQNYMK